MENNLLAMDKIYQMAIKSITRKIMEDRFCTKCNHLCHCVEADFKDCDCENCECMQREEDKTYE